MEKMDRTEIRIAGMISGAREIVVRNGRNAGKKMGRFQLEDLKLSPDQFEDGKVFIGKGCDECFHSGFSGRTAKVM